MRMRWGRCGFILDQGFGVAQWTCCDETLRTTRRPQGQASRAKRHTWSAPSLADASSRGHFLTFSACQSCTFFCCSVERFSCALGAPMGSIDMDQHWHTPPQLSTNACRLVLSHPIPARDNV